MASPIIRYNIQWAPLDQLMGVDPRWLATIPKDFQIRWLDYYIEKTILQSSSADIQTLQARGFDYLGEQEHLKRFISIIWCRPEISDDARWEWSPYAEVMLADTMRHKFYGIAGHASSGKSRWEAVCGIARFIINPHNTKVFLTSTTMVEGKMRIWGNVADIYWREFCRFFGNIPQLIPGHLVESLAKIQAVLDGNRTDLYGLTLVPGQKGHEEVTRMIGFKADNMLICGDEYPLLSNKLEQAADGNLQANKNLQMIVSGNLVDIYDPFGRFNEPVNGWNSIKENGYGMEEEWFMGILIRGWKTKRGGFCRWFDGLQSPNVVLGYEKWKGLLRKEAVQSWQEKLAAGTLSVWEYYRQCRSFPSPEGKTNAVCTPQELSAHEADKHVKTWTELPVWICFLDASFTADGDEACARFAHCGFAQSPRTHKVQLTIDSEEVVILNANLDRSIDPQTGKEKDPIPQIVNKYVHEIRKRDIKTVHVGLDDTASAGFASMLAERIGGSFLRVSFAGAPSELPVSDSDPTPAKDRYDRRVTELWFAAKEFIRADQLKGVDTETSIELCSRTFEHVGDKVKIQKKEDMPTSPNKADALVGIVEVARRQMGFTPNLTSKEEEGDGGFLEWAKSIIGLSMKGLDYK